MKEYKVSITGITDFIIISPEVLRLLLEKIKDSVTLNVEIPAEYIMEVCYRAAKKNHVLFQMGDLYPNLIEVKNFIKCARYLNKKEKQIY